MVLIFAVIYFMNGIAKRSGTDTLSNNNFELYDNDFDCSTVEFCCDQNSLLFRLSPAVAIAFFQISSYFTFGLYFTSALMVRIVLNSFKGFLAFLVPYGPYFLLGKSYNKLMCGAVIDCGASWIPDTINFIATLGLLGTFLLIFFLGKIVKSLFIKVAKGSLLNSLLLFYIILLLTSFPSGNYVTASSSNILCFLFGFLSYIIPFKARFGALF